MKDSIKLLLKELGYNRINEVEYYKEYKYDNTIKQYIYLRNDCESIKDFGILLNYDEWFLNSNLLKIINVVMHKTEGDVLKIRKLLKDSKIKEINK